MIRPIAWALFAIGIAALGYSAYVVIDAAAYQTNAQQLFEDARRRAPAPPPADMVLLPVSRPSYDEGDTIGEIDIPRLGVKSIVAEGESFETLEHAVGHVTDTAQPGEDGNVVLAGHRDTIFRPLQHVRVGDVITVKTLDGDFDYEVESTRIVPPTPPSFVKFSRRQVSLMIGCGVSTPIRAQVPELM